MSVIVKVIAVLWIRSHSQMLFGFRDQIKTLFSCPTSSPSLSAILMQRFRYAGIWIQDIFLTLEVYFDAFKF